MFCFHWKSLCLREGWCQFIIVVRNVVCRLRTQKVNKFPLQIHILDSHRASWASIIVNFIYFHHSSSLICIFVVGEWSACCEWEMQKVKVWQHSGKLTLTKSDPRLGRVRSTHLHEISLFTFHSPLALPSFSKWKTVLLVAQLDMSYGRWTVVSNNAISLVDLTSNCWTQGLIILLLNEFWMNGKTFWENKLFLRRETWIDFSN